MRRAKLNRGRTAYSRLLSWLLISVILLGTCFASAFASETGEDLTGEFPVPPAQEETVDNLDTLAPSEEETAKAPIAEDPASDTPDEETTEDVPEIVMPVLDFQATANGLTVTVHAPEGALPEGTSMEVSPVYDPDTLESIGAAAFAPADAVTAVDITFRNAEGSVIEPLKPIEVVLKSVIISESDNPIIVHMDRDGDLEVINQDTPAKGDELRFQSKDFSVYAVVDAPSTEDEARMTVNFINYGEIIATMYVKNSDDSDEALEKILYDPGIGELEVGKIFKGWAIDDPAYTDRVGENYTVADVSKAKNIAQVRAWAKARAITEGDVINLYAMIYNSYRVTFFDDLNVAIGTDNVLVTEIGAQAEYEISRGFTPPDDTHSFYGWNVDNATSGNIVGHVAGTNYQQDQTITITGDVNFTVNLPEGNWLVFDENGKGGTYNAPQFVESGHVTQRPRPDAQMERFGYTFGGWYKDSACTQAFTFGGEISQKTTIYAKWTPNATAGYTVLIYHQRLGEDGKVLPNQYEVVQSYSGTGTVGTNIPYTSVDNNDEDYATVGSRTYHDTGFCLTEDSKGQEIEITPEGDAVLELYYDRILYNFKFYLYRNGTMNNRYDYANNSGSGSNLDGLVTWHSNQNAHPSVTGYTLQSETVGGRTYHYFVMQAYYEEDISDKWPTYDKITGANGREAVSYVMMVGTSLKPTATNQGSGTVKGIITVLNENILGATNDANGNYVIVRFPDSYYNWRYHIWFEAINGQVPEGKPTHTYNNRLYYEETILTVRSSNTTDGNQNEPKYQGFDYVTRLGQNNNGSVWQGGHWTTNEQQTTLYHLNYVYNRQKFPIHYYDGLYIDGNNNTIDSRSSHVLYETPESEYIPFRAPVTLNYTPPEKAGYVFEGWYIDEACTQKFSASTMPLDGITVYAKWRLIQYRVFLVPDAGRDPTLDWGSASQALSFRISYDKTVDTPEGRRAGYILLGWYTKDGKSFNAEVTRFNEAEDAHFAAVLDDYNKETDFTDTMDKWGYILESPAPSNSDIDRDWVIKKLVLTAKWRKVMEGADGINIAYDANGGSNAPVDRTVYQDRATPNAGPASTPPEAAQGETQKMFRYWVIQTWNEESGEYEDYYENGKKVVVYPGDNFELKAELARKQNAEDYTPENPKYTYTVMLKAEYFDPGTTEPTHIWWYSNFEGSDGQQEIVKVNQAVSYQKDGTQTIEVITDKEEVQINEAVKIKSATTFTRPGYKFLGWARVPSTDEEGTPLPTAGSVHAELDTVDECYLVYHPAEGSTAAYYTVNDGSNRQVSMIAADEVFPYHDMYAVWEQIQYDISVKKLVTGNMGDFNKSFSITVSMGETTLQSLTLKNGQTGDVIKVPYNAVLTITETGVDDYKTKFEFLPEGSTEATTIAGLSTSHTTDYTVTESGTIILTNNKEEIPDTGIHLPTIPFLALFLISLLLLSAVLLNSRRQWE